MLNYCESAINDVIDYVPQELEEWVEFKPYCQFITIDENHNEVFNNDVFIKVDHLDYEIVSHGIGIPVDAVKCETGEGIHHYTVVLDKTGNSEEEGLYRSVKLPYHHYTPSCGDMVYIYVYDQSYVAGTKTRGVSKSAVPIKRDTGS